MIRPLLIQGGRQIISNEFMKRAIIRLFDAMTLGEKIRLNAYIFHGIRKEQILRLFNPAAYIYR